MRAALFDMDRTLINRETATLWMRYQRDIGEATLIDMVRVSFWVLQYTFGVINAEQVAERAARALEGVREDHFIERCDAWFDAYVARHISERGKRTVEHHRKLGDVIAIVTGATSYSARPLAKRLGIEHVVASELEVGEDGLFTGRAKKPLCLGEGKLVLARALGERLGFAVKEATFYSDSLTDLPLLEEVARPVVVNPDPRLRRVAAQRRWPVERW